MRAKLTHFIPEGESKTGRHSGNSLFQSTPFLSNRYTPTGMYILGLEITAGIREEVRVKKRKRENERESITVCRQALREVTRGDGAQHNYYRSRITLPAGTRSLRSRGANLPEYSLPRELISVVIIISPHPRLGAIASKFSRLLRNESFGRKCLHDRQSSEMMAWQNLEFQADHTELRLYNI